MTTLILQQITATMLVLIAVLFGSALPFAWRIGRFERPAQIAARSPFKRNDRDADCGS
jgi:hypothetical protein